LISVALGMVLLKESLRPAQKIAVLIAVVAVALRVAQFGSFPWIALFLAGTFACYGLIRKHVDIDPFSGLLAETLLLLPLALGYHAWLIQQEGNAFVNADTINFQLLIMFSGIVTMVPLSLFAAGARRLNLTTIGILQYLCPCISFCVAIFYYEEAFDRAELWTFSLVWLALIIYTADLFRVQRYVRQPLPNPEG
jgi:chloramphenicol-sensitive protein RarD